MHLTEAFMAAYEATGDRLLLDRAARIARRIAEPAADPAEGSWRLVEHFDEGWNPLPDFNRDDPTIPSARSGRSPATGWSGPSC
ncbi:AGE family epimerase/isomerase [Tessaracoccus coleopterorum]|uniref:AGE family epimerase/isomerase n=1 Tax=Tessaracoccus coleopterorum TaxID=2714950 RepID=UPI0038CDC319